MACVGTSSEICPSKVSEYDSDDAEYEFPLSGFVKINKEFPLT